MIQFVEVRYNSICLSIQLDPRKYSLFNIIIELRNSNPEDVYQLFRSILTIYYVIIVRRG